MPELSLQIERVPHDTAFADFDCAYFSPEVPVIVTGVTQGWAARTAWTASTLHERLERHPGVRSRHMWFEGGAEMAGDDVTVPAIVRECMAPQRAYAREANCRVWVNAGGNVTDWHYDGNSLFVFNVQVRGRKRWTIVSPNTPLPAYPFVPLNLSGRPDAHRGREHYSFDVEAGEMLFLPPYWSHRVEALEAENININWVATKRRGRVQSKVARREAECLRCVELFDRLRPQPYLRGYGGAGRPLVEELTQTVTGVDVVRRIATELLAVPRLLANSEDLALIRTVKNEG